MAESSLTPTQLAQVIRVCEAFEAAWKSGNNVQIQTYVDILSDGLFERELFRELVAVEVQLRARRGDWPSGAEYKERFPGHSTIIESVFATACMPSGSSGPPPERMRSAPGPGKNLLGRYEILGELGRGGMGIVYRARDLRRGEAVALKTLRRGDPELLYRFKQEFRRLASVVHRNLVQLYELESDGQDWFLAMELIEGVNFLEHIRSYVAPRVESTAAAPAGSARFGQSLAGMPSAEAAADVIEGAGCRPGNEPKRISGLSNRQLVRLRAALAQLAEGLQALHEAGKLHRDIKPTNVLVDRAGRVVLLDFGLAAELEPTGVYNSSELHLLGTIAYMAPEQAAGLPLSPSCDWYSVGTMIYQALTGRLPFDGRVLQVLMDKQRFEPPPPSEEAHGVPADLDALCRDLLRRDPLARPIGPEVLRRLGADPERADAADQSTPHEPRGALIGRAPHLDTLADALAAVRRNETTALFIQGDSGVGKTALVQHFLGSLRRSGDAVIIAGRCYEHESVPYKALDGLIDELSRYLRRLPPAEAQALMPRDVLALAQVFPVLRRVEAVTSAPRRHFAIPDPHELRRRAFAALRDMLSRIGDRLPLILFIDDLQWGDVDSLVLIDELLCPPDPPALLLLVCFRSEDAGGPILARLLGSPASEPVAWACHRRRLSLDALSPEHAEELAAILLESGSHHEGLAAAVARESGGNPFFVTEIVRSLQSSGARDEARAPGSDGPRLEAVLRARIDRLPDGPRRLLAVTAVSGRPLDQAIASRAALLDSDDLSTLAVLRAGRYIRSVASSECKAIEVYHDRIREVVVAHLSPDDRSVYHGRLATLLEATGRTDPEILAQHFSGARNPKRASHYYGIAADRAAESLAFQHAARLYRYALKHGAGGGESGQGLRSKLGDALANVGRGAEAAQEYLEAAAGAPAADALELRRRAAMQRLVSGHIEDGLVTLRSVLGSVGMSLPRTSRRALVSLLLERARLRLRGFRSRRRDESEVPADDLALIDICWSAVAGLSMVDPILGAVFQARNLRISLRAGEPYRLTRALAVEAAHVASAGTPAARRVARILQAARQQASYADHPYVGAIVTLAAGVIAYLQGRLREALVACDQAEVVFRDRCTGVTWELDTVHTISLFVLAQMGEVGELRMRRPGLLQEARERNDRYAISYIDTFPMCIEMLAADDPQSAHRGLRVAMADWIGKGFYVQHYNEMTSEVYIHLYQDEGHTAWERVTARWRAYEASLINRVQKLRVGHWQLRGSAAVAAAAQSSRPAALLREAAADADRLDREAMPLAPAYASVIRAGIAAVRRDPSTAKLLNVAIRLCETADLPIFAASARCRLGTLLGGDEGRALTARADAWFQHQGVRHPAKAAAVFVPGFAD